MKHNLKDIMEWQNLLDDYTEAIKYSRWLSMLQGYKKYNMEVRDIYGFHGKAR